MLAAAVRQSVTLCYATSLLRSGFLTTLLSLNYLFSPLALHFSLGQCSVGCTHADGGTCFQPGTALCSLGTALAPSEAAIEKLKFLFAQGRRRWSGAHVMGLPGELEDQQHHHG